MTTAVTPHPLLGILVHGIGAACAATCYTPQKRVKGWSWQTYWMTQALFCWLLLPIIGAVLTIPELGKVLSEAPRDAMVKSYLLGMLYGVGGTAFGIAIRYIGFSLTYAIAIGLSMVLGTLIPPLVKGTLVPTLSKDGGTWVIMGMVIGAAGVALCGSAGRSKEKDMQGQAALQGFNLVKGLLISLLAGVLSAVYNFALEAGTPIADIAEQHGAGYWRGNVVYIFSNTGAFVTTLAYCLYLSFKHRSLSEFVELPASEQQPSLPVNFVMAVITGMLWYGQFFFYNLAHVRMGNYEFSSWGIHMIMLVLISSVVGIILKEWTATRPQTKLQLNIAIFILVGAVLLMAYGNYLGEKAG